MSDRGERTAGTADRTLIARAPARLDFGGGWTDVPPYAEERGGFVCNVAISRYVTATLRSTRGGAMAADPETAIARAALRRVSGADHDARNIPALALATDLPVGAGLGGSSAAGVAAVGALAAWHHASPDPLTLARTSRAIEVEDLGVAGGWQDHLAAAHGGALAHEFGGGIRVRRLALAAHTLDALPQCVLVIYTGESRISATTITAVLDAYRDRPAGVTAALARMEALAREMTVALEGGDLGSLGALVGEHWQHQRSLHPGISTDRIDAIVERAAAAGAWGSKALGASGGGSVLVMAPAERRAALLATLDGLGDPLPFSIDAHGFTVVTDTLRDDADHRAAPHSPPPPPAP